MYIRTMSVLLKISPMRYFWTIILSVFILGFHSCGMVSRVREQGSSKSWVVKGTKSNGLDKQKTTVESVSNSPKFTTGKRDSFSGDVKYSSLVAPIPVATVEKIGMVEILATSAKIANPINAKKTLDILKTDKNKRGIIYQINPVKKFATAEKIDNSKYNNSEKSKGHKSVLFALLTSLSVALMFVALVIESYALFLCSMGVAIVLSVFTIIYLIVEEPSKKDFIIIVLFFIINLISGAVLLFLMIFQILNDLIK